MGWKPAAAQTVTLLALLLAPPPSESAERMLNCGDGLVVVGASKQEVLRTCGTPTSRAGSRDKSRGGHRTHTRSRHDRGKETWIYNLGPSQLVRYLTFKNGRLERIEVGGYGS